jgi:protein required for attachment to host cells
MNRATNIIFVLADGARARLVQRSADTGAFVTVREIDGGGEIEATRAWAKSHPPGRSMESSTGRRAGVGSEDPYRQVKEAFMATVASAAKEMAATREGVVLVAPERLLPVLRGEFDHGPKVINVLAKDLTKTPDHELPNWLNALELAG